MPMPKIRKFGTDLWVLEGVAMGPSYKFKLGARLAVFSLSTLVDDAGRKSMRHHLRIAAETVRGGADLGARGWYIRTLTEGHRSDVPCIGLLSALKQMPRHEPKTIVVGGVLDSIIDQISTDIEYAMLHDVADMVREHNAKLVVTSVPREKWTVQLNVPVIHVGSM